MAIYQTFLPGYDPTADTTAISRSNLNKIMNEGQFADYIGPVIHAVAAPNVSLYPKLAFFIWHALNADLTATRQLYLWDGTDWQPLKLSLGSITGDQIADGTISLAKLDADGLGIGYILRVGASGIEAVSFGTIMPDGSVELAKLVAAGGADYLIVSIGAGSWSVSPAITYLKALFTANAAMIPHTSIFDVNNSGSEKQVLGRSAGANAGVTWAYIETLLRANETPTSKLKFDASLKGKLLRVNAGGTDVEDAGLGVSVGILKYTGVTNTPAQAIPATTETTVEWNNEVDPDNAIAGVDAGTDVITLETGTYEIECTVPMQYASAGESRIVLMWRKVAGSVIQATQTMALDDDDDRSIMILRHVFDVTDATEDFDVRIYTTIGLNLGLPLNVGTYVETYQTLVIRKLA